MRQSLCLVAVLLAAALTGCGKKPPREFTKAEFEVFVAQKCKLREVTLEPQEDGKFTGTGVDGDGKTYQVEATQEPDRLTWMAKHGEWKAGGVVTSVSGSESR